MVDHNEQIDKLKSVDLFSQLSDDSLAKVAQCVTEFEVKPGHVLVEAGQPGAGLFIVIEGEVRVRLPHQDVTIGPGEFFGDLALLDADAVHTGRVQAVTEGRFLALSRDDFDRLLDSEPGLAVNVLRVVARRLVTTLRSE
jgi:voltage-gated potassium channel